VLGYSLSLEFDISHQPFKFELDEIGLKAFNGDKIISVLWARWYWCDTKNHCEVEPETKPKNISNFQSYNKPTMSF